jgi:hypothetical protein
MNDLFEDDKNSRINLKDPTTWNDWLSSVFQPGECTCVRCKECFTNQEEYIYRHTFKIEGENMSRRFATSTINDFESKLKAAWISFYELEKAPASEPNPECEAIPSNEGVDTQDREEDTPPDKVKLFNQDLSSTGIEIESILRFTHTINHKYLPTIFQFYNRVDTVNNLLKIRTE